MVTTESAAGFVSRALDADSIESKEAAFMVLGPWETVPPELGLCDSATGFLCGGIVLPPQYKRAINAIAAAMVIKCLACKEL